MSEPKASPPSSRPLTCPACFAKDIDPVILQHDSRHHEYYCTKCTYSGTAQDALDFLRVLQAKRYRVNYNPGSSGRIA